MNHFLRFATEQAMDTAMQPFTNEDGVVVFNGESAIDVIGEITLPGTYDVDGIEIEPSIKISGWHVNFLGELPMHLAQFEVFPENPFRIWA